MATVEGHSTDRSVNTYGLFVEVAAQFIPHHLGGSMLYDAYEMQRSLLAGASTLANIGAGWMQNPVNPFAYSSMGPIVASALHFFAHVSVIGRSSCWERVVQYVLISGVALSLKK